MKLLYDSMLNQASLAGYTSKNDKMISVLQDAKVFVIDNVSDYWYEVDDRDTFSADNFPNIAPQYESMFFEYSLPHFIRHPDHVEELPYPQQIRNVVKIGVLLHSDRLEDGWTMTGLPFIRTSANHVGRLFAFSVDIKNDGSISSNTGRFLKVYFDRPNRDNLTDQNIIDIVAQAVYPAFLAISFMHCKNVTINSNSPSRQSTRKNIRDHGRPLVTYKTLSIEPLKAILKNEGGANKTGLKLSLHICRGHFKDYSKGDGLFGKYRGLYWWDSHIRGEPSRGVVVKDYKVNPPSASEQGANK